MPEIYQSAGRLPENALPPLRGFGTARLDALHPVRRLRPRGGDGE